MRPVLTAMAKDFQERMPTGEIRQKGPQKAADGPQPPRSMRAPRLPPPEENSSEGRRPRGFALQPELRYRPGRPKHGNFRLAPKEPGWRPYHPRSLLSVTDVLAIRATTALASDLAQIYGCGVGTIRDIRAGRRGRLLQRYRGGLPDGPGPAELRDGCFPKIGRLS